MKASTWWHVWVLWDTDDGSNIQFWRMRTDQLTKWTSRQIRLYVFTLSVGVREAKGGVSTCRTWIEKQLSKSEEHDMIYAKHTMLHQMTSLITYFLRVPRQAAKHHCPDSHNNNNNQREHQWGTIRCQEKIVMHWVNDKLCVPVARWADQSVGKIHRHNSRSDYEWISSLHGDINKEKIWLQLTGHGDSVSYKLMSNTCTTYRLAMLTSPKMETNARIVVRDQLCSLWNVQMQ